MLIIIEPKSQALFDPQIKALLDLLKIYQGFKLSPKDQEQATYIIAHDRTHGVYGGAVLYPQKVSALSLPFKRHIQVFVSEGHTIWCAALCLCLNGDEHTADLTTLALRDLFYVDIYALFCELGREKQTNWLLVHLSQKEYAHTLKREHWYYTLPAPVQNPKVNASVSSLLYLIEPKHIPEALKQRLQRYRIKQSELNNKDPAKEDPEAIKVSL